MRSVSVYSLIPFAAAVAIVAAYAGPNQGEAAKAPQADLPGITTEDKFPKGCVDCHIKLPDGQDVRLSAVMKTIKDHPDLAMIKNAPTDCKMCHKPTGGMAPGLNTILHKYHYAKKGESKFVQMFQGNCLSCHAVDLKTGKMTIKAGPKNW